jgi:hypothetical protein
MSNTTASSSSSTTSVIPLGPKVIEKLTRDNYVLWKVQVLPPRARLIGFLDGSAKQPEETMEVVQMDKTKIIVDNPEYATWLAHDQLVLAFLYNSISK